MKKLYRRIRHFDLPKRAEINAVFAAFSRREWIVFNTLMTVLIISTVLILGSINKSFTVAVPGQGGEITEGIVGAPRFVNPVLASSAPDLDLVNLVYSGLMRKVESGDLVPDLAASYEVSKDGLVYTFTLKDKIYFHDGTPLTSDDIVFTVARVKDSVIKSPEKINWDNVTAEAPDAKTVVFTLRQTDTSFLESATLGILPQHIWVDGAIELNSANTTPVGSGPYLVSRVNRSSTGVIGSYELNKFDQFALGKPNIGKITLRFYQNEDELVGALEGGAVKQASSLEPKNAEALKEQGYRVETSVLPRIFGLFFNQNQNQIFADKAIVRAVGDAIDKDRIVRDVLLSYGVAIDSPIPLAMEGGERMGAASTTDRTEILKKVEADLAKSGWTKGADGKLVKSVTENKKKVTKTVEFSISTGNAPELAEAANLIKENLEEIGMKVDIKTFEIGNLNQSVIRPRKYDALLFGQIVGREGDLYAFWHSSQRLDPGLNISMYTNAKVDKILEDAFVTQDEATRQKKYAEFEAEIKKDQPAVFLYSPNFIYVVADNLQGLEIENLTSPANRFLGAYKWYTEVENVWRVFAN